MTQPAPMSTNRRRTVGRSLVALGVFAIGLNVALLLRDGGSSTPQWVNVVLGAVILGFGIQVLRKVGSR